MDDGSTHITKYPYNGATCKLQVQEQGVTLIQLGADPVAEVAPAAAAAAPAAELGAAAPAAELGAPKVAALTPDSADGIDIGVLLAKRAAEAAAAAAKPVELQSKEEKT